MPQKMKKLLIICMVIFVVVVLTVLVMNYTQNTKETNLAGQGISNDSAISSKPGTTSGLSPQSVEGIAPEQPIFDKQDSTKIIKKSNLTMQTDNYDNSLKKIYDLINSSGAMIVKMQENQGNNYDLLKTQISTSRNAEMTIKISKDKFEIFNGELKKYANVTSYYEEAQDISSAYADIEAKIGSYKIQEAQLNELIKKATAAKDLLEISNQTQKVIEQRESLQRQKDSYDNQISYSTVTVRLTEVESIEIKEKGTFSRIGDTFKSSLSQIKELFINTIMCIVYIIPYIIIILIIGLIIYIIHKLRKKQS
jgi:hypothetical protein